MKRFYLFFAAICCTFITLLPQKALAKDVKVCYNGVYYAYSDVDNPDKTVEVTSQYYASTENSEDNYSGLSGDVVIPSKIAKIYTVTRIHNWAFGHKKNGGVFNVTLPSTIEKIEYSAFCYATKLYSIQLNEGLKEMGDAVFSHCTALTEVYIPTTLKEIPDRTFDNCTSLPAIALSAGIEHIGSEAFFGCTALQSVKSQGGANNVKTIGAYAFYKCSSLYDVRFSNGLTSIGTYAFYGCTKLENLTLPAKLATIGDFAFLNSGLKTLTVNMTTPININANVFTGVDLSQCILYVPKGCKEAYKNAEVWKKFGNILEPGEVPVEPIATGTKKIGDLWYDLHGDLTAKLLQHSGYNSLTGAIKVPATVTFGKYTYTVNEMGEEVFSECSNITSATLPNTITEIPERAFYHSTGLTNVTMPSVLTSIGQSAFNGCTALTFVSLPASLTEIGAYAFYGCKAMTSVYIPAGVKIIGKWCFRDCDNLASVKLTEGLTEIQEYAFAECTSLTTITLPASLQKLGTDVFNSNKQMVSIRSLRETPPTADANTFRNMLPTCILYVPSGTKDAYAAATGWSYFAHIQEKGLNEKIKYGKLYYQLEEDGRAYVTYETKDENNYKDLSGVITVEDKVIFKGFEYKVYAIGDSALMNCKGITKVNLPLIMDRIRGYAFGGCTNLAEINIPTTVSFLMSTAFEGTKLFNDNIDADGAVYYDGCMLYGPNKTYAGAYVVKDGTRLIASAVFFNRGNITSLTLPEGLLCICNSSIYWMNALNTLSLPGSLYSVGTNFCSRCPSLRSIYNYSTSPVELTTCFNQLNKDWCTLYVPKGSRAAYESAENWKDFPIVEMDPIYTVTFEDYNGFELKSEKVAEGEAAHAPAAPEREGYDFTGWDVVFTNVQSDLTVTAQYTRKQFTVRFLDGQNENALIDQQQVEWGLSAIAPEPPVHEGFHFTGWDLEFDIVTADLDVIASYAKDSGTGIEETIFESSNLQIFKSIKNGTLFIRRDGRTYTVEGQEVK